MQKQRRNFVYLTNNNHDMSIDDNDYKLYRNLEKYLRGKVFNEFHEHGFIGSEDFFCIIIWKANRAKSKIAKMLLSKKENDLELCCIELTKELFKSSSSMERLHILIGEYGFRLPIASAILSIFYPNDFSIYDIRICETLTEYKNLAAQKNFKKLWERYCDYIEDVRKSTPKEISLIDKDHYLWGKSFFIQLQKDIKSKFNK